VTDLAPSRPSTRNAVTLVLGLGVAVALVVAGFLLLSIGDTDQPDRSTGRAASIR